MKGRLGDAALRSWLGCDSINEPDISYELSLANRRWIAGESLLRQQVEELNRGVDCGCDLSLMAK